ACFPPLSSWASCRCCSRSRAPWCVTLARERRPQALASRRIPRERARTRCRWRESASIEGHQPQGGDMTRLNRLADRGMATVEYAMVTIAAAAFAAVLIAIIRSPEVRETLMGLVTGALSGG